MCSVILRWKVEELELRLIADNQVQMEIRPRLYCRYSCFSNIGRPSGQPKKKNLCYYEIKSQLDAKIGSALIAPPTTHVVYWWGLNELDLSRIFKECVCYYDFFFYLNKYLESIRVFAAVFSSTKIQKTTI